MIQQTIVWESSEVPIGSAPATGRLAASRIYIQPLATNTHRMTVYSAENGGVIKSIAAPGTAATAIFDDLTLEVPGDANRLLPQEYLVWGTPGEGCVVTYWPS